MDGAHAAGRSAGALGLDDGVVGADVHAAAALDALLLVDGGAAGLPDDGVLGADLHTGVGQAALAQVRDLDHLFGAAVAGELDHVDQRGIVVLVRDVGVLQARDHAVVLVHAAGGQADGQADALLDDGAFQEDVLAQFALLAGDDLVGDAAHHVVCLLALDVGVGHPGDFGEYRPPDLDDGGIDASEAHSKLSFTLLALLGTRPAARGGRAMGRAACSRVRRTSSPAPSHTILFYHILPALKRENVKKTSKPFRLTPTRPAPGRRRTGPGAPGRSARRRSRGRPRPPARTAGCSR